MRYSTFQRGIFATCVTAPSRATSYLACATPPEPTIRDPFSETSYINSLLFTQPLLFFLHAVTPILCFLQVTISDNATRLNTTVQGPPRHQNQPVIVFISGGFEGGYCWARVASLLAHQVRTVRFDQAGTGQSSTFHTPRSAENIAQELEALLQTIAGIPRLALHRPRRSDLPLESFGAIMRGLDFGEVSGLKACLTEQELAAVEQDEKACEEFGTEEAA
ncbi:hypothetical protein KC367_g136 [Hortaea werneckii]|nr:hypothetical protein KC367_g136 [Hortaea werneckii]